MTVAARNGDSYPLYARFPALRAIPRVSLCTLPSPVLHAVVDGADMWIKRDGLNAPYCGGNKARMLEFLLANVRRGDTVLTVGGAGSTHVLATAIHARRLGARTIAVRWRHEMNDSADQVSAMIGNECVMSYMYTASIGALARAQFTRLTQRVHYVPLGASTPIGVLAMVNAALELSEQVRAGLLPRPARLVVPLGSGGTVSGLALGLAIAGMETAVVGVQVTPSIIANRVRVRALMARSARLIERMTGESVARVPAQLLGVARGAYGGAYGRTVPEAREASARLEQATGIRLDQTYSSKAFAVALELAHSAVGPTLFWNTFDSRLLR